MKKSILHKVNVIANAIAIIYARFHLKERVGGKNLKTKRMAKEKMPKQNLPTHKSQEGGGSSKKFQSFTL